MATKKRLITQHFKEIYKIYVQEIVNVYKRGLDVGRKVKEWSERFYSSNFKVLKVKLDLQENNKHERHRLDYLETDWVPVFLKEDIIEDH